MKKKRINDHRNHRPSIDDREQIIIKLRLSMMMVKTIIQRIYDKEDLAASPDKIFLPSPSQRRNRSAVRNWKFPTRTKRFVLQIICYSPILLRSLQILFHHLHPPALSPRNNSNIISNNNFKILFVSDLILARKPFCLTSSLFLLSFRLLQHHLQ